jgi:hypothetical protein
MSKDKMDFELNEANPLTGQGLAALDLGDAEAALREALIRQPANGETSEIASAGTRYRRRHPWRLLAVVAASAVSVALAAFLLIAGGEGTGSSRAYGAELVRFAESTPLLLLEEPGWQVRNVIQWQQGSGSMEFGPGAPGPAKPHPSRREIIRGEARLRVGRRTVKLSWARWSPRKGAGGWLRSYIHQGFTVTAPVLGTVAHIDPDIQFSSPEAPGLHWMVGVWREGDRVLTLSAWVPDIGAFRERLGSLTKVDAETWLDAMPQRVVKAADYGTEVREMLQGLPLPLGFDPSRIPDRAVTTNRYSVGRAVGGAVACGWFARWFDARATRDAASAQEARGILLRSGSWPVFQRISDEGSYPQLVVELAEALPSGLWGHDRPIRQIVNNGCTAIGFPLEGREQNRPQR